MTVSAVPALIDALISTLNTAFASSSPPVQVFDGVGNTSYDTGQQVWVGISDPFSEDASPEAATADQTWPYAGGRTRREQLTVHLVAQAWNGGTDQKTVRDQAYAIVNAVTAAIVADPTLGNAVLMVEEPAGQMTLRQVQDDKGVLAQVAFDVTAMAQF